MEAISDGRDEGMPIMLKDLVLIKVVRLRTYDGSYLVPNEDKKNVNLYKPKVQNMALPKSTEWKVIWSGEAGICNFVCIYGKVLTIRGSMMFLSSAYIEPWPVLDGAGDWLLEIVSKSVDSKAFQAKLKPARYANRYLSLEVFMGYVTLCAVGDAYFFSLQGWTIEVVKSSPFSEAQQRQGGHQPPWVNKIVNHGVVVANSQLVGGDYSNSGYNTNVSGTQKSGSSIKNAKD